MAEMLAVESEVAVGVAACDAPSAELIFFWRGWPRRSPSEELNDNQIPREISPIRGPSPSALAVGILRDFCKKKNIRSARSSHWVAPWLGNSAQSFEENTGPHLGH